jgi:carboxypeptidase T
MRRFALVVLLSIGYVLTGLSQAEYLWVRIAVPDRATMDRIHAAGIDFEGVRRQTGGIMEFLTNESDRQSLTKAGVSFTPITKESLTLPGYVKGPANAMGFGDGSLSGFYTFSEVRHQLDSMRQLFPSFLSSEFNVATTWQDRPVVAVEMTSHVSTNNPKKPEVLFTAMHHAREPEGMMTVIYYMWWLLNNYGHDDRATYLLDHRRIWFVPVVNPDGYVYNEQVYRSTQTFGYWRKNMRDNNGNSSVDASDGVDLNRNYGPTYMWNASGGGSSTNPSSDTYRGPSAFSEPEVAGIRDFIFSHNFMTCLNYHTYGNDIIYPWGYILQETPDSLDFREFAFDLTADNRYTTGTDLQTVYYTTRGNSDDFMYDGANHKTYAMTPEVGTSGFWPPTNEILPLAAGNLTANIYLTFVAGQYTVVKDYRLTNTYGQESLGQGDQFRLEATLRNKGLADAAALRITGNSEDGSLQFANPGQLIGTIPARSDSTIVLTGAISASATMDLPLRVFLTLTDSSGYVHTDTIQVILGRPDILLSDNGDDGTVRWTTGDTWGIASSAHTPPASFTDSPFGGYVTGVDASLTLKSPIYLYNYTGCRLSFWTKWDITPTVDFASVEVSTDGGSNWTSLRCSLSRAGSGSGIQNAGTWGYDGYPPGLTWVHQYADLTPFINHQILIRFRMNSLLSGRDGIYIDDISILGYGNRFRPVQLTITDNTPVTGTLTFDENSYATDGIDTTLGEAVLPPPPGAGTFDIRWEIPSTNGTLFDARSTLSDAHRANLFTAALQPGSGGYPFTIRWNASTLRPGSWHLRDAGTRGGIINVNMWTDTAVTIAGASVSAFEIAHTLSDTIPARHGAGWQIAALPVIPEPGVPPQPFLPAFSPAFGYEGHYVRRDTLSPLTGYWVRFAAADSVPISGSPVVQDTLLIPEGWSLLGGTAYPTRVEQWKCNPAPCTPYIYAGGYSVATVIQPGTGFWMKGPRTVILSCIPAVEGTAAMSTASGTKGETHTLKITDAVGNTCALNFVEAQNVAIAPGTEIPPIPPGDLFDVRFADNRNASILPASFEGAKRILIQSEAYPLTLEWATGSTTSPVVEIREEQSLPANGVARFIVQTLSPGSRLAITDRNVKSLTVRSAGEPDIPASFGLSQNYPNPFNPSTTIKIDIPSAADVRLEVINILGQTVAVPLDGETLDAGRHSFVFDGRNLSTGVYLYRMTAFVHGSLAPEILQKSMLLIK